MKENPINQFRAERERLNEIVMKYAGRGIKRFYSIDAEAYKDGALPVKTKELLGLVASLVLRCDDCIRYHLINCREAGVNDKELDEALNIGLVVGGSITIPHLRRALRDWDELKGNPKSQTPNSKQAPNPNDQ
jgi:AhpD family alkylhydroperoxidase